MYRVKRLSPGEEMSSFLRVPKTGWVTSCSTKRLSWKINDLEGCRKNSTYIGVRHSLVGGILYDLKEPEKIGVPEEEDLLGGKLTAGRTLDPEEAFENEREQSERSRIYAAIMAGLMRTRKVKGMTAEDLATVLQRRG